MPMNRVQFQPGLSMFEFLEHYGSEEKCELALAASRWPLGWVCPRCEGRAAYTFRRGPQPYRECVDCHYQCTLIPGTMFEAPGTIRVSFNLPPTDLEQALATISSALQSCSTYSSRIRSSTS